MTAPKSTEAHSPRLRAAPLDSRVLEDADTELVVADVRTHIGEEDARRLAACWNACRDIPTAALEAGALAQLVEHATRAACETTEWAGNKWVEVTILRERWDAMRDALRALGRLP